MSEMNNMNNSENKEIELAENYQLLRDMDELSDAATALFLLPIFFSHQNLFTLGPAEPPFSQEQQFVIRMFKEFKKVLLFPRTVPNTDQFPDTTLENVRRIIKSSYGTAAVLLKPTRSTPQGEPYSPFLQFEPSMAYQYGHPLLLVKQSTIRAGGIWGDAGPLAPFTPLTWFSNEQTVDEFFSSVQWKEALQNWAAQVRSGFYIQTGPEYKYMCDE